MRSNWSCILFFCVQFHDHFMTTSVTTSETNSHFTLQTSVVKIVKKQALIPLQHQ